MANLRIVKENKAADYFSISGSTESGDLLVENIATDLKSEVWRTTTTSGKIILKYSTAISVDAVLLPFTNFTATATIRVRLYTLAGTAEGSPDQDTGVINACEYADSVGGVNTWAFGNGTCARAWPTKHTSEKVIIDIADTSNADGYIEMGCLVVGEYFEPEFNFAYGANSSYADMTSLNRNAAGDNITTQGVLHKTLNLNFEALDAADRNELQSIIKAHGKFKPLFISAYPANSDDDLERDHQIYGTLKSINGLTRNYLNNYISSLAIESI